MRKIIIAITTAFLPALFTHAQNENDRKEIETVCNYYIDGGANGDSLTFSKAFSPTGQMQFMRNDTLRIVSLKDFMAGLRNTGIKQNRTSKIEYINIYGNAASAKITIEYPTFFFHDIMGLLKTKEGWKIVNKIFYREEKVK
jgi:hypothetical protein